MPGGHPLTHATAHHLMASASSHLCLRCTAVLQKTSPHRFLASLFPARALHPDIRRAAYKQYNCDPRWWGEMVVTGRKATSPNMRAGGKEPGLQSPSSPFGEELPGGRKDSSIPPCPRRSSPGNAPTGCVCGQSW